MKWASVYQLPRNTCAAVSACSYYALLSSNAATSHGGNLPLVGAHAGDALHTVAPQYSAYSGRHSCDNSVVERNSLAADIHLLKTGRCALGHFRMDRYHLNSSTAEGGAYKDVTPKTQRWVAWVGVPASDNFVRYYVLGKYDSERQALSVCDQVVHLFLT